MFKLIGDYFYEQFLLVKTEDFGLLVLMFLSCELHDNWIYKDWLQIGCSLEQLQDWIFLQLSQLSMESVFQNRVSEKDQLFWLYVSDRHTCQACSLCTLVCQKVIFKQGYTSSVMQREKGSVCPVCGPILDKNPWERPWLMSLAPMNGAIRCWCGQKSKTSWGKR